METRAIDEAVIRELGTPKEVEAELTRLRRGALVLSSRRAHLIGRYENRWVAVYDGKVQADAESYEALLEEVKKTPYSVADMIIRYITRDVVKMIL